ncbi:MAG: hypothetical protein R3C39_02720 [Dehalococcoidia bacterium]
MALNAQIGVRFGCLGASVVLGLTILAIGVLAALGTPSAAGGRLLMAGVLGAMGWVAWRGSRPDARQAGRRTLRPGEGTLPGLALAVLIVVVVVGAAAIVRAVAPE